MSDHEVMEPSLALYQHNPLIPTAPPESQVEATHGGVSHGEQPGTLDGSNSASSATIHTLSAQVNTLTCRVQTLAGSIQNMEMNYQNQLDAIKQENAEWRKIVGDRTESISNLSWKSFKRPKKISTSGQQSDKEY